MYGPYNDSISKAIAQVLHDEDFWSVNSLQDLFFFVPACPSK